MGGKGGRKRKGGGVPTPGFGAGGQGGRFGGLISPSPTPSVAGWETDEGEAGVGVSREAVAKVPRLGVAASVADVAALSGGLGRLEVASEAGAAVRLRDKVVEIGKNLPGIRDWLLDLAVEAVTVLGAVQEERAVFFFFFFLSHITPHPTIVSRQGAHSSPGPGVRLATKGKTQRDPNNKQ